MNAVNVESQIAVEPQLPQRSGHTCPVTGCWKRNLARWSFMIIGAALSAFGIQLLENDWFILVLPVIFGGLAIWSWMARFVSRSVPVYPTVFSDMFFIAAMFIFGFVATGVAMIISTSLVEIYAREDWFYFEYRHRLLVAAIYFPVAVVNGWIALVFDNYRNRQVKQFALGGS